PRPARLGRRLRLRAREEWLDPSVGLSAPQCVSTSVRRSCRVREHLLADRLPTLTDRHCARTSGVEATGPTRPLTFRESVVYGFGNLGANAVYNFLNGAAGLYLNRYPEVPIWLVGLLSQERSLAGAFAQPIVGALSDRTRTRIGRRKPYFIAGVALTAASLLYLSGFPP